jgi:HPt (histidine-containing phosphotransfer) domain-containing protein
MCLEAGMNDYVSKPVRVNELMAALSRGAQARGSGDARRETRDARRGGGDGRPETGEGTEEAREQEIVGKVEAVTIEEQAKIRNLKPETQTVLDPAAIGTLLEVIGGERELLVELIDSFLETAPPLLARLHHGVAQGNAAEVRAAAHTIKSSSQDFGATRLAELCQTLEDMGKASRLTGAAELAAQVEAEYRQVKSAVEAERAA